MTKWWILMFVFILLIAVFSFVIYVMSGGDVTVQVKGW